MKSILIAMLVLAAAGSYGQASKPASKTQKKGHTKMNSSVSSHVTEPGRPVSNLAPGQTATDLYLNGPASRNTSAGDTAGKSTGTFASGVHAAANAAKPFGNPDTNSPAQGNATAAAPFRNDTTYNANTVTANGLSTNSGAVDKSGQTQFGQSNWGDSRGTVGESQWTVPPPVTSSFSKEFPQAGKAVWTRSNTDSTLYSARYRSGSYWVSSNYNAAGQRLDQRTEYQLNQAPQPVSTYIERQPSGFQVSNIYKVQAQGKPDVYELQIQSGKKIYINMDGTVVEY